MKRLTTITKEDRAEFFKKAYRGSYYTITGAAGDIQQWIDGYDEIMEEYELGEISQFYSFTGEDMNEHYGLEGSNAYPPELVFLAFPLAGLNTSKMPVVKLIMKDRWFDDIVNNNAEHQS